MTTRRFDVRVEEDDLWSFGVKADLLDTSKSQLMRALMALPVDILKDAEKAYGNDSRIVVLEVDRDSLKDLTRQVRAYGYHYNQAVKALNALNANDHLSKGKADFFRYSVTEQLDMVNQGYLDMNGTVRRLEKAARNGILSL